jgi:acetylornithine deacetylase
MSVPVEEESDVINPEQRVFEQVDHKCKSYVELLRSLVQMSETGEATTQQHVADHFAGLGCDIEVIRYNPHELPVEHEFAAQNTIDAADHISVVGRLSAMADVDDGRSILFFAHPDAEPVSGTDSWEHSPFAGEIEDGRLYGWGVADDLLGVATMIGALDAVVSAEVQVKGDVVLASTPSKRHARGIIAVLEQSYTTDAAVYLHPAESGAGLRHIKSMTSGLLRFRITVPGRPPDTLEPSHTAFAHLAVDPVEKAWLIYDALSGLDKKRGREVHHAALDKAVGRSTNLHITYVRCGDEDHLSRIDSECVLAGSVIFPPGETMEHVQAQVEAAIDEIAQQDEWLGTHPPKLEWIAGISSGAEVSSDHPLYQTVCHAVQVVTGQKPTGYALHSASDIRNPMLHKGIPTVGLGSLAGDLSQAGGHDEWIDVEDYIRAIKVVGSIILDWCG